MKYQDQVIQKEINILVEVQIVIPIVQFQLVAGIVTSQNLLFQMRGVLMFCISGKEMGAPTGNWLYDSARDLTEMASMQFAVYGLMNPYTYQRPKITPLPNETGLTVPGGTGVAVVPNGTAPALKQPYLPGQYSEYPAAVQGWAQQALPGGGSAIEGGRESSIMDYSNRFADSLAEDFNPGVEVRDVVKEDMILVQFSSDAPNASLRYWTTIDEANGISTIEEYMDKMALSKEWGNRNVVKVARVKKGTEVTHAIGTAKAQTKISDPRPGNGKQILFSKFDSNWITEVRNIKE